MTTLTTLVYFFLSMFEQEIFDTKKGNRLLHVNQITPILINIPILTNIHTYNILGK